MLLRYLHFYWHEFHSNIFSNLIKFKIYVYAENKYTLVTGATSIAKDAYKALMKGEDKVVSGLKNKAMVAMANIVPDTVLADQMKKQSEETK